MKNTFLFLFIMILSPTAFSQERADSQLRVVDSLKAKERGTRNPIILRSELDSLKNVYYPSAEVPVTPPKAAELELPLYVPIAFSALALGLLAALFLLWKNQQANQRSIRRLKDTITKEFRELELESSQPVTKKLANAGEKKGHSNGRLAALEGEKLKWETAYQQVVTELDALKQQIMQVYKVRNYPGYSREKSEAEILASFLATERSISVYAYESFLKPLHALADQNKNNPARISREDQERILELLVSLGLFFAEYLYLRVNELAIGGKMVQRIGNVEKGNDLDQGLLKELNTEHGSRALTLRVALDKMGLRNLSYPVFDETNLNQS